MVAVASAAESLAVNINAYHKMPRSSFIFFIIYDTTVSADWTSIFFKQYRMGSATSLEPGDWFNRLRVRYSSRFSLPCII